MLIGASRAEPLQAPRFAVHFGSGAVHAFTDEMDADMLALGAFSAKRRIDRFDVSPLERPIPWRLYGRLGVLNFQNELEAHRGQGMRLSLRRTGPRLSGRIYVGVHRTFH